MVEFKPKKKQKQKQKQKTKKQKTTKKPVKYVGLG
jgi:hypothetical protein